MKSHRKTFLLVLGVCLLTCINTLGEYLGPGKYSGEVIFDRWDGCYLYRGIYLVYISEKIKEDLRPYAGKEIGIEATKVVQPMNPGDCRIEGYESITELRGTGAGTEINNLEIKTGIQSDRSGTVVATLEMTNIGKKRLVLGSRRIALTLIKKKVDENRPFSPSDGPSHAVITRQGIKRPEDFDSYVLLEENKLLPFFWSIDGDQALFKYFSLSENESKTVEIRINILDGEYEFLGGYSDDYGRNVVTSNLISFDIKKGKLVTVSECPH